MSTENIPALPETPPLPESGQAANLGSPISDLSYRSYSGPLKTRYLRWWVVALSGLKQTFSQPLLYVLLGLPTLRFMVAAAQLYFTSNFAPNLPNFMGEPDGQKYANIFWSAMCGDFNALITVLIAVAVGAGSISADNRSNALLVYLAKPIGKADYLFGKWLSIFLTLLICLFVPVFFLYLFCAFSYRDGGFFTSEPWLGPRLLLGILIPATIHSSLIVGFSAWSKSPRIVGAIYTSFYLVSGVVAGIISRILYRDNEVMRNLYSHFCLRGVINGIQQNNLHVVIAHISLKRGSVMEIVNPPLFMPLFVLATILVVGGIVAARSKINAVEVIRG